MSTLSISYRSENGRDDLHKRGEDLDGQHSGTDGSSVVRRHLSLQRGEEVGALLVALKHLRYKGAGVRLSIMASKEKMKGNEVKHDPWKERKRKKE